MKDAIQKRLESKRTELERRQKLFFIAINRDVGCSTYEDNAISALLDMKTLKTEISELETCLQLL